jgi:hypothetical protein
MKDLPSRYTELELQALLEGDTLQPENIHEADFLNEIRGNPKIRWRVNHFLFTKKLLPFLLDTTTFKKWRYFKYFNWLFALTIIGFAICNGDYRILLFLILYPFLIITFDHWIFLFNMSVVIGVKFLFNIHIPYFWFFIAIITAGYLLNKAIDEMLGKYILAEALADWKAFWKYYSGGIISMDETALNNEYDHLIRKYPELLRNTSANSSFASAGGDE